MTDLSPRLTQLGDALERAARADLRAARPRKRRRILIAVTATLAVLSGGAALAGELLGGDVSNSMLAGAAIFEGTHPTCTEVVKGVEWHCVLDRAPQHEVDDFTGTKEATVDATKHVNGGCEGLDAAGLTWECYLGEAAVQHQIVGEGFLGQLSLAPGHG
jgi:hypothetical protein